MAGLTSRVRRVDKWFIAIVALTGDAPCWRHDEIVANGNDGMTLTGSTGKPDKAFDLETEFKALLAQIEEASPDLPGLRDLELDDDAAFGCAFAQSTHGAVAHYPEADDAAHDGNDTAAEAVPAGKAEDGEVVRRAEAGELNSPPTADTAIARAMRAGATLEEVQALHTVSATQGSPRQATQQQAIPVDSAVASEDADVACESTDADAEVEAAIITQIDEALAAGADEAVGGTYETVDLVGNAQTEAAPGSGLHQAAPPASGAASSAPADTSGIAPSLAGSGPNGTGADAELAGEFASPDDLLSDPPPAEAAVHYRLPTAAAEEPPAAEPTTGARPGVLWPILGPLRLAGVAARPACFRACAIINAPLNRLSPELRNIVGYAALITVFNATCLLVYALLK